MIVDRPEALELVHAYDQPPSADFLIQEFFGTDFSRSYLALQTLQDHSAEQLWPALEQRWHAEAHNDYGAHYFFIRLFSRIGPWPDEALRPDRIHPCGGHHHTPAAIHEIQAGSCVGHGRFEAREGSRHNGGVMA